MNLSFTKRLKDNSIRLIWNLKNLNEYMPYEKFKMETLKSAVTLITPECWMASIHLVFAYYSVPIAKSHMKYLEFIWRGERYSFTSYPNAFSQAPWNFAKITKPLYGYLYSLGHITTGCFDNCLLIGATKEDCKNNITTQSQCLTLWDMLYILRNQY